MSGLRQSSDRASEQAVRVISAAAGILGRERVQAMDEAKYRFDAPGWVTPICCCSKVFGTCRGITRRVMLED
jgi:hypothetical protein